MFIEYVQVMHLISASVLHFNLLTPVTTMGSLVVT
jgi:hypothetical protein